MLNFIGVPHSYDDRFACFQMSILKIPELQVLSPPTKRGGIRIFFLDLVTLHAIASWQHREHVGLHFRHGSSIAIPEADYQRYCPGYHLDYQSYSFLFFHENIYLVKF
jgi:hypothetical protein